MRPALPGAEPGRAGARGPRGRGIRRAFGFRLAAAAGLSAGAVLYAMAGRPAARAVAARGGRAAGPPEAAAAGGGPGPGDLPTGPGVERPPAPATNATGGAAGAGPPGRRRRGGGYDPFEAQRRGVYSLYTMRHRVKARMERLWPPAAGEEKQAGAGTALWESCAVVGNSGSLLGAGHGARIDAHAVVIRLNNAPVAGFGDAVGAKTNVSVVNGWKLADCERDGRCTEACWPYGGRVALLVDAFEPQMRKTTFDCQHRFDGRLVQPVDGGLLRLLETRVMAEYETARIKRHPRGMWQRLVEERRKVKMKASTGLQAVFVALSQCERVGLFGFGEAGAAQHHYYEADTVQEIPDHSYGAEQLFYQDLVRGNTTLEGDFPLPAVTVY